MRAVVRILLQAIAIAVAAYVVPGVHVDSFFTAVVVAVVLGILNALVKPILLVLTFPVTVMTLGLFAIFLNVLMIVIASKIVSGFTIDSFWIALVFGLVLGVVNWFLANVG